MAKTKSKLNLSQRKQRAFQLFARGYTNLDAKTDLKVSNDTIASYRKQYEERIQAQAAANPEFISDVLANTLRLIEEGDQVRADAWKHLGDRKIKVECPHCEHVFKAVLPVTDQTRAQYHNVILKALDLRAKVFGVLGVKAEMFAQIQQVQYVQTRLIEWMLKELPKGYQDDLANFMETELKDYMGGTILELASVEVEP